MMKRVNCSVAFVSVSLLFSCRIDVVDRNAPFDFIARYDEIGFAESPLRRPPIEGVAWRGATGIAAQSTASMLDRFENDEIHIAANPDLKKLEIRLDLRDAIFAPVPTRIEADLVLGNDPYLSFGYGVDPSNWDVPGEAFFEASIRTKAGERRLFSKALDPQRRRRHRRWFDDQLSLRDYGGERVTISLQTRAVGPQNRSTSWSTPRVIYPRKKGEKNVILISLDTLRADHLNCYGYTARETSPNIDEFARDGTRFATVISSSPWTTPSHMSILTSLYPSYHGVNGPFGDTMRRLNMKVPTIAERLRAAGYVTAAFTGRGSISARYGFSKGFDRYHETERIRANDLDRIYEKTSAWLEANSQFKFFLFFHTYEVHRPNTHDVFEEAQTSRSRKVRDVAGYDSDLRYTDAYIDRLMEKLKSLGIYDESIIILLSDHGENLHDRMVEIQPIGHGYHVYDKLLKVPLIFVMPGEVLRGQVVERQVSLVDVMPTILDLLSIENPDFMQGESLAAYLYGERDSSRALPDTSMAFSEATAFGPERIALRSEGFKYIFIPDLAYDENRKMGDWDWSELDPRELFDLEADPSERNNLELGPQSAQEYRRRIREFHQRIVDFRAAGEQFVRLRDAGDEFTLDENLLENLRALGYIE